MVEDFDSFEEHNQIKYSIERYEEMLRKHDSYFFDVDAFANIIDYYMEKNNPAKALQVIEFAEEQHPSSAEFLLRRAQLLGLFERYEEALAVLEKAEMLFPRDADLYMVKGSIY